MLMLGTRWLNCLLVSHQGTLASLPEEEKDAILDEHERYRRTYLRALMHSVWYDLREGRCFGAAQFRGGAAGKEYNFLDSRESFLEGRWGRRYFESRRAALPAIAADGCVFDREMIYTNPSRLRRYQNARILLVLGGPTTAERAWQRLPHENVWSCNKFYLDESVVQAEPNLIALGSDVPLGCNPPLLEYLDSHDALILFDLENVRPGTSMDKLEFMLDRYRGRVCLFHTRYNSALGLGVRMLCFAAIIGAGEILFVGLDGMQVDGIRHAFEPGKALPRWYDSFGDGLQRRQYVIFWEYWSQLKDQLGFHFVNLGEGSESNISTPISRVLSPLSAPLRAELENEAGS